MLPSKWFCLLLRISFESMWQENLKDPALLHAVQWLGRIIKALDKEKLAQIKVVCSIFVLLQYHVLAGCVVLILFSAYTLVSK